MLEFQDVFFLTNVTKYALYMIQVLNANRHEALAVLGKSPEFWYTLMT